LNLDVTEWLSFFVGDFAADYCLLGPTSDEVQAKKE